MQVKNIGKNQIIIETTNAIILQSYNTVVAAKINGKCYKTSMNYSATTTRHINNFIGSSPVEIKGQEFFNQLLEV